MKRKIVHIDEKNAMDADCVQVLVMKVLLKW
jgi:hypothetical protein